MMEIREINVSEVKAEDCIPSAKFVENIGTVGIKVPVMLRKNGHGYMIVDGRRRIQAARNLGMEMVPAVIVEDEDSELMGLMLNLQRSPNLAHEADTLRMYIKAGYTQKEIADLLNVTRTQLKKHFRLLNLCKEALNKIKSGEMSGSIAFELSRLPKEAQKELVSSGQITKEVVHGRKVAKTLSSLASLLPVDEGRDPLVLEFESFVSKVSTGRTLPEEVMKAIDAVRRFIKNPVKEDATRRKRLWRAT